MLVLLWTKIVNISKFPKRNFLVSNIKLCRSLNGQFHPPAAVGTQRRVAADRSRAASPAATDCILGDCGGDDADHLKKNTLIRSLNCGPGDMSTTILMVLAAIINHETNFQTYCGGVGGRLGRRGRRGRGGDLGGRPPRPRHPRARHRLEGVVGRLTGGAVEGKLHICLSIPN